MISIHHIYKTIGLYTENFLRMVYPLSCSGCGREIFSPGQHICWKCWEDLPFTTYEQHSENPIRRMFDGRTKIENAFSLLHFTAQSITQSVVHSIKYKNNQNLGIEMGKLMGKKMQDVLFWQNLDGVVPLPLHKKKLALRGFNQSELLAEGICEILHIPMVKTVSVRKEFTTTQTKKTRMERWVNVENAFGIKDAEQFKNKHLLLVDDVITTGATLEAMANQLQSVEGIKISIATLAQSSRL